MRSLAFPFSLLLALALLAAPGRSQCEHAKLTAFDGAPQENFGRSVAIEGDYAVVGAPNHTHSGLDQAGAVYVFERINSTWVLDQKLVASDPDETDIFGWSVSISADRIAVGAILDDENGEDAGAVYVFVRDSSGWTEEQKLVSSAGEDLEHLGQSVSLDDDRLVTGAQLNTAYVFERGASGWTEITSVTPSASAAGRFGDSIALDGNRFVVGARGTDDPSTNAGAIFVFTLSDAGWIEEAYITSPNPTGFGQFGNSVDISGTRIAVGAPFEEISSVETGRAYVYRLISGSWTLEHSFTEAGLEENDLYGWDVSISDINVLVGAPGADTSGAASGVAFSYQYVSSAWTLLAELEASDASSGQEFGIAVQVRGVRAIIGAEGDSSQGAAYIFGRCP